MLARQHEDLRDRLVAYHDDLQEGVAEVSRTLHELGTPAFKEHE
jgi:5-(carboxyamino)imidazole ribonucleotide mutase